MKKTEIYVERDRVCHESTAYYHCDYPKGMSLEEYPIFSEVIELMKPFSKTNIPQNFITQIRWHAISKR